MKGKISSYDHSSNTGKILTEDNFTISFTINEFIETKKIPEVGKKVIFDYFNNKAYNIIYDEINTLKIGKKKKKESNQNQNNNKNEEKSETNSSPQKREERVEEIDVKTSIDQYFADVIKETTNNSELLRFTNSLDYIKVKRFLMTAYNNLVEIDCSFENLELSKIRKKLNDVYDLYKHFKKNTNCVEVAYEVIFLNNHPLQKELQEKLKTNKDKIFRLNCIVEKMETAIKKRELKISQITDKQNNLYKKFHNELKVLKRNLVDAIHEIAILKEQNNEYTNQLKIIYETHFEEFKNYYTEFIEYYESNLKKILDVIAFQFNKKIWQKAKQSEIIKDYFEKADVKDDFNALTYLRYYLRSLDESKINEKHQNLYELSKYLEEQKTRTILCLDDDPNFLSLLKDCVKQINNKTTIIPSTRTEIAINNFKQYHPNVLIINPDMKGVNFVEMINYVQNHIPDIEIAFFATKINKDLLMRAKHFNVTAIIHKTAQEDKLIPQLQKYLSQERGVCLLDLFERWLKL
jgi:CheY-like chemotaxis protein